VCCVEIKVKEKKKIKKETKRKKMNEQTNKRKKSRLQFLHIRISSESLYKEYKSQDYKT